MENDCRACACDRDDKTNHGSAHTCQPVDREQRTIAILARIPASAVEYALNCAGDAEMKVWIANANDATEPETARKLALEAFFAKLESLASVFPASVPRWEYLPESVRALGYARATQLGADGWEMVGAVPGDSDDPESAEVWFKRRLA